MLEERIHREVGDPERKDLLAVIRPKSQSQRDFRLFGHYTDFFDGSLAGRTDPGGICLTIGNFDGCHLGHRLENFVNGATARHRRAGTNSMVHT